MPPDYGNVNALDILKDNTGGTDAKELVKKLGYSHSAFFCVEWHIVGISSSTSYYKQRKMPSSWFKISRDMWTVCWLQSLEKL